MRIDEILRRDDSQRLEDVQRKQVEYTYVGSTRKQRGHRVFYFNRKSGEMGEASIKRSDTIDFTTLLPTCGDKVDMHRDCIYMQALNMKNFVKKLKKLGLV